MFSSQVVGALLLVALGLAGGAALCFALGQAYWTSVGLRARKELKASSNLPALSSRWLYSLALGWIGLAALMIGGDAVAIKSVYQHYLVTAPAPLHRVIAYVSDRNGSNDIWLMDEYGHTRALTFDMANERQPRWSPDGGWITFLSNREGDDDIFMMSPEGNLSKQLTHTPEDEDWVSWSPDGSELLFTRGGLVGTQLCILKLDVIREVVTADHCIFTSDDKINKPSFSPDGQQIVFNLGHNGHFQLWIVGRDGSDPRALDRATQSGIAAWSPDGKRIVYRLAADYNQPSDVELIAPDGTSRRYLRHIEASQVQANWSPDGKQLCFTSDPSDPPLAEMGRLGVMNADGTGLKWLDKGENWVYWQAQSWQIETWDEQDRILYSHKENGQYDLYLVHADGSGRTRLTDTSANEFHAVFRPVPPLKQR